MVYNLFGVLERLACTAKTPSVSGQRRTAVQNMFPHQPCLSFTLVWTLVTEKLCTKTFNKSSLILMFKFRTFLQMETDNEKCDLRHHTAIFIVFTMYLTYLLPCNSSAYISCSIDYFMTYLFQFTFR